MSVYEIKIGTLNAPLIFHQRKMFMNTANYNHTNTGKTGDISCKLCYFYKCMNYISAKTSLCPPLRYLWVNDYKGSGISWRDHYIFCPSVALGTACIA